LQSVKHVNCALPIDRLTFDAFTMLCPSLETISFHRLAWDRRFDYPFRYLSNVFRPSYRGDQDYVPGDTREVIDERHENMGMVQLFSTPAPVWTSETADGITIQSNILARYIFAPNMMFVDQPITFGILPNHPLGDRIWAIVTHHPCDFSTVYSQIEACTRQLACPRKFRWRTIILFFERISIQELQSLLELFQAPHLELDELTIWTVHSRGTGCCSTRDFALAGPRLWRLLRKFKEVTLDLGHDPIPLPSPGSGPEGLAEFSKTERLALNHLTIFANLPEGADLVLWKGTYDILFRWLCEAIIAPDSYLYLRVRYIPPPTPTSLMGLPKDWLGGLYQDVDMRLFWAQLMAETKALTKEDCLWEWEHGSLPADSRPAWRGKPGPGWHWISGTGPWPPWKGLKNRGLL
jgi:hypothetical protein